VKKYGILIPISPYFEIPIPITKLTLKIPEKYRKPISTSNTDTDPSLFRTDFFGKYETAFGFYSVLGFGEVDKNTKLIL